MRSSNSSCGFHLFQFSTYAILSHDTWGYQQSVALHTTSINLWCIDSQQPSHTFALASFPFVSRKSAHPSIFRRLVLPQIRISTEMHLLWAAIALIGVTSAFQVGFA
ncbi:hypothetical protein Y032_0475g2135 [Ancylostoma ceylanicum]|uniref:Uncharacterized protein n=1 Tax=Ancylostoma ceylanicum TaxID=53326 RepID=A0A016WXK8_9BILA|nr:hypothetical protein Y032_0475g2135 [Ancylostoma ceylanicum]